MAVILASASPRRQQLLDQIGCCYVVSISDVIEDNGLDILPRELAVHQARAKALAVARSPGDVVIGADTIVVVDGAVFGKPADDADARRMLGLLSGREHQVITGVAVVAGEQVWSDWQETAVKFRVLTAGEIERYVMSGEAADKAGAYAIQGLGALLIDSISGCYSNVVGLPLVTLNRLLTQAGVRLL